jgi:hypothetical protein
MDIINQDNYLENKLEGEFKSSILNRELQYISIV